MRHVARHFIGSLIGVAAFAGPSASFAAPAGHGPGFETSLPIIKVQCGQSVPCPGGEFAPGGPGYGGPSGALGAVGVGMTAPPGTTYVEVDGRLLTTGALMHRSMGPRYGLPADHVSWCAARFRSYDPGSDTYIASNGRRRRCVGG